jgi:hypothetical protein
VELLVTQFCPVALHPPCSVQMPSSKDLKVFVLMLQKKQFLHTHETRHSLNQHILCQIPNYS